MPPPSQPFETGTNAALGKMLDRYLSLPDRLEDYSFNDAIRLARFAIRLNPRQPSFYFHIAAFYSAINKIGKSLFYYEEALKRGFRDWNRINSNESFRNARNSAMFQVITSTYRS